MRRLKGALSMNVEDLTRFRTEVVNLYKKFEEDLVTVSRKFGFKVNMWYSPSKIPQPSFKAGRLTLDADKLYSEQNFKQLVSQHYPTWNTSSLQTNTKQDLGKRIMPVAEKSLSPDAIRKNVFFKHKKQDFPFNASIIDFKQNNGDLRLKHSKMGRRNSY